MHVAAAAWTQNGRHSAAFIVEKHFGEANCVGVKTSFGEYLSAFSLLFSLELTIAAKKIRRRRRKRKKMDYEFMEEFIWLKNSNPCWMG
jgi:hypothetical protein